MHAVSLQCIVSSIWTMLEFKLVHNWQIIVRRYSKGEEVVQRVDCFNQCAMNVNLG